MSTEEKATREEAEMMISEMIRHNFDRFIDVASVENVYGKPVQKDDALIIPTAEIMSGMGFGTGFGENPQGNGGKGSQTGGGGGGGGRVVSRPVATIIADQNGVRVEPVIDKTKITIAGLMAGGLLGFMLLRLLRHIS